MVYEGDGIYKGSTEKCSQGKMSTVTSPAETDRIGFIQ